MKSRSCEISSAKIKPEFKQENSDENHIYPRFESSEEITPVSVGYGDIAFLKLSTFSSSSLLYSGWIIPRPCPKFS